VKFKAKFVARQPSWFESTILKKSESFLWSYPSMIGRKLIEEFNLPSSIDSEVLGADSNEYTLDISAANKTLPPCFDNTNSVVVNVPHLWLQDCADLTRGSNAFNVWLQVVVRPTAVLEKWQKAGYALEIK